MATTSHLTRSEVEDLIALKQYVRDWFVTRSAARSFRIQRSLMTRNVLRELVEWASDEGCEVRFVDGVVSICAVRTVCPCCLGLRSEECTLCFKCGFVNAPRASAYFARHPEAKAAITLEMPATRETG